MRAAFTFVSVLMSTVMAQSAPLDEPAVRKLVISEEAIEAASARLYAGILVIACINGHRYPLSRIRRGFKRHAGEMKMQLLKQGYRIAAKRTADPVEGTAIPPGASPESHKQQWGCFRQYWLDD